MDAPSTPTHPHDSAPCPDLHRFVAGRPGSPPVLVLHGITESRRYWLPRIERLAAQYRLPSMCSGRAFVEAGGLMSYVPSPSERRQRLAAYVDKLLKGAKPGDLPIEQPTKFEFVINLKTAQASGLTIPPMLLFQADEVIQ